MSDDGKFRRKSISYERRLNFLLQSFSLDEADLDKCESQMIEMEDILQQVCLITPPFTLVPIPSEKDVSPVTSSPLHSLSNTRLFFGIDNKNSFKYF